MCTDLIELPDWKSNSILKHERGEFVWLSVGAYGAVVRAKVFRVKGKSYVKCLPHDNSRYIQV